MELSGSSFAERAVVCPLCGGAIHRWSSKKGRRGGLFHYDRCGECDFVFVNPRPTLQWLGRYYSENSSELPDRPEPMATPVPPARDSGLVRAIESMLGFRRPPGRFLDVGAGRGGFSHAAKMAGLDVTALEVDPQDVRMLQAIGGLSVIPTTLEEFDEKPGSFDYVLMSHVLEHAHDPKQWIKKASMLLAPGGILAIMLPHFNSVYRFLVGTGDPYFFPPEHLNHFNRRSLGRQCTDCGLLEAGCRTETSFPSDVITKRVPMPNIIRWPVQRLTAIASAMAGRVTSATGCGHVLIAHYKKRGGA